MMGKTKSVLFSGLLLFSEGCSDVTHSHAIWLGPGHGVQTWHHISCIVIPIWMMKCIIRTQQNSHRLFTHVSWKIQLVLFVFSMTHATVRTGCFCSFLVREHYSIWTFCFSSAASQRQWSVVVTGGQEVTRLVSHLWKKKDWHGPEDTDDLGHALWLFLSRKSKTIPSEECLHSTEQTPLLFI